MMKRTNFSELYHIDFEIEKIFAYRHNWLGKSQFNMTHPRPTNAFIYFSNANAKLVQKNGETVDFVRGDLAFIPKGLEYTWFNDIAGKIICENLLFEFILTDRSGNEIKLGNSAEILDSGHIEHYTMLFEKLLSEQNKPIKMPAAVRESAYSILVYAISRSCKKKYSSHGVQMIADGISYLENDVKQEKSIEELAEMCGVSIGHFEKLFKSYSGMSPCSFRLEQKIRRAEMLLRTSDSTLEEIAEEVGFCDAAYLCRVFEKRRGSKPSDYRY